MGESRCFFQEYRCQELRVGGLLLSVDHDQAKETQRDGGQVHERERLSKKHQADGDEQQRHKGIHHVDHQADVPPGTISGQSM